MGARRARGCSVLTSARLLCVAIERDGRRWPSDMLTLSEDALSGGRSAPAAAIVVTVPSSPGCLRAAASWPQLGAGQLDLRLARSHSTVHASLHPYLPSVSWISDLTDVRPPVRAVYAPRVSVRYRRCSFHSPTRFARSPSVPVRPFLQVELSPGPRSSSARRETARLVVICVSVYRYAAHKPELLATLTDYMHFVAKPAPAPLRTGSFQWLHPVAPSN